LGVERSVWGIEWKSSPEKYYDVSAFSHLSFWSKAYDKGTPVSILLMDTNGNISKHEITIETDWRFFNIPLAEFRQVDLARLDTFAIRFVVNGGICVDEISFMP